MTGRLLTLVEAAEADEHHRQRLQLLHSDTNPDVDPSRVTIGSRQRVFLTCNSCPCGHPHEWETTVYNVWRDGKGCPVCSGRKPCACNSLAALHPDLCRQWDTVRNQQSPRDFRAGSNQQVWWICAAHTPPYSWLAAIQKRAGYAKRAGTGCPQCAQAKRTHHQRQPTVAEAGPPLEHLAQQWHPDNALSPEQVTLGSMAKALWRCANSTCQHPHVWSANIRDRTQRKAGCPFCSGRSVCPCNSLQGKAPELAAEWDHEANAAIGKPEHFAPNSHRLVRWQHTAADGSVHRWLAQINARHSMGTTCPICMGRK